MQTIQNSMTAAASMVLSLTLFAISIILVIYPFVLVAGPHTKIDLARIAMLWIGGSAGLIGVFAALRR